MATYVLAGAAICLVVLPATWATRFLRNPDDAASAASNDAGGAPN